MKTEIKYRLISLIAVISTAIFIGCSGSGGDSASVDPCDVPIEASLNTPDRIGGAVTNVELLQSDGAEWTLFNIANELRVTQVDMNKTQAYGIEVEGFIQDIEIVDNVDGKRYALLAMGSSGISAVDITNLAGMSLVTSAKVNYEQTGITFADGGGTIWPDNNISGSSGPISSVAVYEDGGGVLQLLIGDKAYGLHKTALSNFFDTVNGREEDGTLKIEDEAYTLQYAGENPWGGPESLKLYGGKLFVAQGFLGMGIYDPQTLDQVGSYNLYTDATGDNGGEDWFINMNVADEVQGVDYLDACTGMPNYNQASYEIQEVWHNPDVNISEVSTPWADFDRYGKFYYNARKVDIAPSTDANVKTIAYIAYGLGGIVAVDVTGFDTATTRDVNCTNNAGFLQAKYLGYAPALPAHGPDEMTGAQAQSLYPYFGAGMLKETGIIDVKVDTANNNVYYSDHFAGLLVMKSASHPWLHWHGDGVTYNNDTDGILGNHWPDYEFVTSYDMTPVPLGEESVPAYILESPILLKTGELSGHGNEFALSDGFTPSGTGQVDLVISAGGGGLSFIDLDIVSENQEDNSFDVPVHIATTDEVGAAFDGSATQEINIGHAAGVTSHDDLLFLADGPHGMTVWKVADSECTPTDDVHVVANSLQSEYQVDMDGTTIYPTPHAHDVILDGSNNTALVMSQSRGVRRVSLSEGTVGNPVLLYPKDTDIFEHNKDEGNVVDFLSMQDHAYDVAIKGTLAFTADGSNGLTVYDLSKDPTDPASGYVVSNVGGDTDSKPKLGQASGVVLWNNAATGKTYAFVAAGSRGIGVVDVTDAKNMILVKVFEPIKIDELEGHIGEADGKSVDVKVVDNHAFFTYDSFGVVAYSIADLIKPLPEGMDPTNIWDPGEAGERPEAVARFKLQDPAWFGSAELSELSGGAVGMDVLRVNGKNLFYIAYGDAGVIKIDWTNPANPVLLQHANTVGFASDVTVVNGRAYVADGAGGLALFK